MMNAYYAFCALKGLDNNFEAYIANATDAAAAPAAISAETDLRTAVCKGLKEAAKQGAQKLLETMPPLEIIQTQLIPALDEVGKGFEAGTIFLPQLLMSADAAKAAFEVLKSGFADQTQTTEAEKHKIVIATVQGDIHDIGKNIVKVLLENYGFEVLDLGKDVPPERILEVAKREQVRLVGLSALMTTTVESMARTIALLHREYPSCKIMVGGAVLTQDYADRIGADFYSKDAMGSVRYAEKLFS